MLSTSCEMETKGFRLPVQLEIVGSRSPRKMFIYVDPEEFPSISLIEDHIKNICKLVRVKLYVEGHRLPKRESVNVILPGDVITAIGHKEEKIKATETELGDTCNAVTAAKLVKPELNGCIGSGEVRGLAEVSDEISSISVDLPVIKRKRVRKRRKKHPEMKNDPVDDSLHDKYATPRAISNPCHIRFAPEGSNNARNDSNSGANQDGVIEPESNGLTCGQELVSTTVSNPLTYPLMDTINTDDTILFKKLKIDANYCPVLSNYIHALVKNINESTKVVSLKILDGSEELILPEGKFSLESADNGTNDDGFCQINMSDLYEIRLVSSASSL